MWIALNDGFFSTAESKKDGGKLVVRARLRGDLERVWGDEMKREGVAVEETPLRDYRFRTVLSRKAAFREFGVTDPYTRRGLLGWLFSGVLLGAF